ncbi:hypothetical protein FS837_000411 [Tulasnella sp. UAMH 9824]|nr:hypothetical protein FS837_000411 [Tulasnella sp. UAMH 9824]
MNPFSLPPGLIRKELVHQLREEARNPENIPPSVYDLTVNQIIVVHYEREVFMKEERDVVQDLAQALPGIEPLTHVWKLSPPDIRPVRFAVFISDFDEDPLARSLRSHHNTLAISLLKASSEIRPFTNFACRPVNLEEKMPVARLVTGYVLPFEGASLILERDREAIIAYEAEYEDSVRLYRIEQSKLASEGSSNRLQDGNEKAIVEDSADEEGRQLEQSKLPSEGTSDPSQDSTDGATGEGLAQGGGRRIEQSRLTAEGASNRPEDDKDRAAEEDLADGEGRKLEQSKLPSDETSEQSEDGKEGVAAEDLADGGGRIERSEGAQEDGEDEGCSSGDRKRRIEGADEEDQATHNAAGPSSASTSTPLKKRQRTNNPALDPITSDDRDKWINHVVESEEAGDSHYDLLKEFLLANERDHNWTIHQWNNYLKENTTYIARQVDQLKRYGPK